MVKDMKDMLLEKRIDSEVKFKGKLMTVETDNVMLSNGKTAYREVIRKHGGVCILPLTDEGEVIFVNQFRYPYAEVVKEIPSGKMEKGEDPLECGLRELSEETGYTADKVISLGKFYPTPAIIDEVIYIYLATQLKTGEAHLDEGEFLTVEKIGLEKALQMVLDGEIVDGKTQTAILKTWVLKQKGQI